MRERRRPHGPDHPAEGFFQMPSVGVVGGGTHRALCEDFLEEQPPTVGLPDPPVEGLPRKGCGVGVPVNACAGNPALIAPQAANP